MIIKNLELTYLKIKQHDIIIKLPYLLKKSKIKFRLKFTCTWKTMMYVIGSSIFITSVSYLSNFKLINCEKKPSLSSCLFICVNFVF